MPLWHDSATPCFPEEKLRATLNFRARVADSFLSGRNAAYLGGILQPRVSPGRLASLGDTMRRFVSGYEGAAIESLSSDSIARRGNARPASDLWAEVRRLNREFYDAELAHHGARRDSEAASLERRRELGSHRGWGLADPEDNGACPRVAHERGELCRSKRPAGHCGGPPPPVIHEFAAQEPYHIRAFFEDSIFPEGLEGLNAPGGTTFDPERYTLNYGCEGVDPIPHYNPADWPWDGGDATRTAEQARAEYWGEDLVTSDVVTRGGRCGGRAAAPSHADFALRGEWYYTRDHDTASGFLPNGKDCGTVCGTDCPAGSPDPMSMTPARDTGGPRRQRYVGIPFWQFPGHRDFDRDIGETLGVGGKEMGNQVRSWDMERLRAPRGQEYRRYGARTSDRV